ncbi:MAG TPA: hypothetical protein VGG48_17630 [Rhizomicrobium sp.]|jgi:hypothetical protein
MSQNDNTSPPIPAPVIGLLKFMIPFEIVFAIGLYAYFRWAENDAATGLIAAGASLLLGLIMVAFTVWSMMRNAAKRGKDQ